MKKSLFFIFAVWFAILGVGCSEKFDDTQIWDKLNSLEERVAALEQLCRQMNTNISSLQTIVDALQNKDYVTNVTPITEDGKVIGYTIWFSKSGAITIYHGKDGKDGQNGQDGADGKDGKDGYTPVIGIAKDTDGLYYWTLDGDWLLDSDGNKIKAVGVDGKNGADGKDGLDGKDGADGKDGEKGKDGADGKNGTDGKNGKDGVTPKLKIENGYWFVSYDNGENWIELGKATGEDGEDGNDGDSMFKDITYDNEYVYITLIDGTQLVIPINSINIPNNQIWYTNGSTTEATTPLYTDIFGANIISNEYDATKELWVITFDGKVTSIGDIAFYNRSNLTSITIPDSVTSIGKGAFSGCSSLTSITIPDSVTSIGKGAFSYCSSLTNFYSKFASADNRCFIINGVLHSFAPAGLTTYTIPNYVTSIGEGAFSGCKNLTSITIPNSVTEIEEYAFNYCI